MTKPVRYLSAEGKKIDDFGVEFTNKVGENVYDAKTKMGPWAMMTEISWQLYGTGLLGIGYGQRYIRNETGELILTEGGLQ